MRSDFENILKDKLQDYSLKPEPRDWTALERSLGLDVKVPKRVPLYRYVTAAAAVLLLAVGSVYLLRMETDAPIVPFVDAPVAQTVPPPLTVPETDEALDAVLKLKETIDRSKERISQLTQAVAGQQSAQPVEQQPEQPAATPTNEAPTAAENQPAQAQPRGENRTAVNRPATAPADTRITRRRRTPNSNWALALFADGAAGSSGQRSAEESLMQLSPANSSTGFMAMATSRGVMQVEQTAGSNLYKVEASEWKHALPLTFGLSLRKNIAGNWGVETGVNYSYLSSKAELSSVEYRQQLHYLGVPLAITYTPWSNSNLELYGRVGGAADFNIAGRQKETYIAGSNSVSTKNFTVSGVQWSLTANVGITYRLSPAVGLYFEPGVSHYFENSHQVDSYWKQNPTNFNMKIGVRTSF